MDTQYELYYFPDEEYMDMWFGIHEPVCLSTAALARQAEAWGVTVDSLLMQVHEAGEDELADYGIKE